MEYSVNEKAKDIITEVIQEDEGGWVLTDRKNDSGGTTYGGMTFSTFNAWQKQHKEVQDQILLWQFTTLAAHNDPRLIKDIIQCYYDTFWVKGNLEYVPEWFQKEFYSACINMGVKEATKCLQMAFNVGAEHPENHNSGPSLLEVDGKWGPKTRAAMKEADNFAKMYPKIIPYMFSMAFSDACMVRYIRIVQRNAREWRECALVPKYLPVPRVLQSENLMGWFNRAKKYRKEPYE